MNGSPSFWYTPRVNTSVKRLSCTGYSTIKQSRIPLKSRANTRRLCTGYSTIKQSRIPRFWTSLRAGRVFTSSVSRELRRQVGVGHEPGGAGLGARGFGGGDAADPILINSLRGSAAPAFTGRCIHLSHRGTCSHSHHPTGFSRRHSLDTLVRASLAKPTCVPGTL